MLKNEAQEKIINTIDGQLIVVACPGSGKTTTLVRSLASSAASDVYKRQGKKNQPHGKNRD